MSQADDSNSDSSSASPELRAELEALMRYATVGEGIESFWRDAQHRRTHAWDEHRDINEVMLATSLAPEGFLFLRPPP